MPDLCELFFLSFSRFSFMLDECDDTGRLGGCKAASGVCAVAPLSDDLRLEGAERGDEAEWSVGDGDLSAAC